LLRRSFPAADPAGAIVLSRKTVQAHYGLDSFSQLLVQPAGDDFASRLDDTAALYGLQARATSDVATAVGNSIAQTLLLFGALTGAAALIGALSILNTMSLNVEERAQTIGLLRAAGMTRAQTVR